MKRREWQLPKGTKPLPLDWPFCDMNDYYGEDPEEVMG